MNEENIGEGDFVTIIADEPEYGWQGVLMGDVGQVRKRAPVYNVRTQNVDFLYYVDFPRSPIHWKGLSHELKLVEGQPNNTPIPVDENGFVSDGGSSDYYRLPEHATELRHLISAKGMSKSRGDIFKACFRLGEKAGVDVKYDLEKMKFFIEDLLEMHERGEHL